MKALKTLKTSLALTMLAFTTVAMTGSDAHAQKILMGATKLMKTTDVDVIKYLGKCPSRKHPAIYALQLKVLKKGVDLDHVRVTYENGMSQELAIKQRFFPGQSTRKIDLNAGYRCVDKITIVGDTEGFGPGQALIKIFGFK